MRGQYADGISAVGDHVTLSLTPDGLEIIRRDGTLIAVWPGAGICLVDNLGGGAIRLTSETSPEARLTITDPATARHLQKDLVGIGPGRATLKRIGRGLGWSVGSIALLAAIYFALPSLVEPAAGLVPENWKRKMGAEVIGQLSEILSTAKPGTCTEPAGVAALERVSRRLTTPMETPPRFQVSVINSSLVNAFAILGGQIVLLRGLIDEAQTPEEITGVMAHEIGHVMARHPTKVLLREMGVSLIFSTLFGNSLSLSPSPGKLGPMLVSLSYSRDDEAEADAMALKILKAANIRSGGLVSFFERLRTTEGKGLALPAFLSTHPETETRIPATTEDEAGRGSGITTEEWAAIKAICGPPEKGIDA